MAQNNRRGFLTAAGFGALATGAGIASCSGKNAKAAPKRIMVGGFSHETNTFNPRKTTLEIFKKNMSLGTEVLQRGGHMVHGTVGDSIGGFLDVMEMFNVELIGSIRAGEGQGIVTKEAFDYITGVMLDTLDKNPVDAVYLSLHGGGVAEDHPDMEGDTLALIRKKVGPGVPIMFTMDLHCKPTKQMTEVADAVSVYRTYPHVDAFEVGKEIADIMLGTMFGKIKPVMAVRKLPLMIGPPLNVVTSDMPIKLVYDKAKEMERTIPGVLNVCPCHGFMQQDVPTQGAGVLVTVDRDRALAQKLADELGDLMFSYRKDYWVHLPYPDETIRKALELNRKTGKPVAIADGGDNMGAGTPGDGTALLAQILKQGVKKAFVQIWDPESAKKSAAAGAGATVTLDVGGKSDALYGPPVKITGKVAAVSDFSGKENPAARIEANGITILVNTAQIGPNDQKNLRAIGVDPSKYVMVVCKGGFAFRPQYPNTVYEYIMSNTPGYASVDLSTFKFTQIPRPIYPLDTI
ncbi:MAG: M81 family metallopeptidase [Candidatus Latescibacter sp.]|nr:M81 family metallopeptidase [Candidatus Latescibacter sp.]